MNPNYQRILKIKMSNMNIALLDDEEIHLNFATKLLEDIPYVRSINAFTKPSKFLSFLDTYPVDVVLMDIDLPNTSGINLAELVAARFPKIKIIFVSAHTKYAIDSFKVYPVDYIIKPIDYTRLERSLKKVKGDASNAFNTKIGIKVNSHLKLISLRDIIFVEKIGRKSMLHLLDGTTVESYESISQLEKKLTLGKFFRCYQSYLVSIDHITDVLPDDFASSYNIRLKGTPHLVKVSKHKYKDLKILLGDID